MHSPSIWHQMDHNCLISPTQKFQLHKLRVETTSLSYLGTLLARLWTRIIAERDKFWSLRGQGWVHPSILSNPWKQAFPKPANSNHSVIIQQWRLFQQTHQSILYGGVLSVSFVLAPPKKWQLPFCSTLLLS